VPEYVSQFRGSSPARRRRWDVTGLPIELPIATPRSEEPTEPA